MITKIEAPSSAFSRSLIVPKLRKGLECREKGGKVRRKSGKKGRGGRREEEEKKKEIQVHTGGQDKPSALVKRGPSISLSPFGVLPPPTTSRENGPYIIDIPRSHDNWQRKTYHHPASQRSPTRN